MGSVDLPQNQMIGVADRLATVACAAGPTRLPRRWIPEIPEDGRAKAAGGVGIRNHAAQLRVRDRTRDRRASSARTWSIRNSRVFTSA
jgi:hypothetical protein